MKKASAFLIAAGILTSSHVFAKPSFLTSKPLTSPRMVEIQFHVDDSRLLGKKVIEFAIKNQNYERRFVKMVPSEGSEAVGHIELPARSDKPLSLIVCGYVSCAAGAEMEMICGESEIPTSIPVTQVHQINYSTIQACQDEPSSLRAAR